MMLRLQKVKEENSTLTTLYTYQTLCRCKCEYTSYVLLKGYVEGLDEFRGKLAESKKGFDYSKFPVSGLKR